MVNTVGINKTPGAGINLQVTYTNDLEADKGDRVDLQLATNLIDNRGFYQKDTPLIQSTVADDHGGHAIFNLTYAELVFLYGQKIVDDNDFSTVTLSYRYRVFKADDTLLAESNVGDNLSFNKAPGQPHGTSLDTSVMPHEDTRIRITGFDQKITFEFKVTSGSELTNMKGDVTAEGAPIGAKQAEIMFNRKNLADSTIVGIESCVVDLVGSLPVESIIGSDDYKYTVKGHTTVGTGLKQITLDNNVEYEMAIRVANINGKSVYSKAQTVICSNKTVKPTINRTAITNYPEDIAYLTDVYTSFRPEVYQEGNEYSGNYTFENIDPIFAAQVLIQLADGDVHNPDQIEIEFGVLNTNGDAVQVDGTSVFYPDTDPYSTVPDDHENPRKVLAFEAGRFDTYELSPAEGRYKDQSNIVKATLVKSYGSDGTTPTAGAYGGNGATLAGYAGLKIGDAPGTSVSNEGCFVRRSWFNGEETALLLSARIKQTTMVPGPIDTNEFLQDGTTPNPDHGKNTAPVANIVYSEVETIGTIFRAFIPEMNPVRLGDQVEETHGVQSLTVNADDAEGNAGVCVDEVESTLTVKVTNNDGLDLTLAGGYGYDGSGSGSGYQGVVGDTDPNQPQLQVTGTTFKLIPPADTSVNEKANYQINYNDILAINAETDKDFADNDPNSAPSREIIISVYQGDANKTYIPFGGNIIQYARHNTILLHPFKTAAVANVTWEGKGVNVVPELTAAQFNEYSAPTDSNDNKNNGSDDNHGFIFQTVAPDSDAVDTPGLACQTTASNKYRAYVYKQEVGPVNVVGALGDTSARTMADFLFNGNKVSADATGGTSYSLPKDNTDSALKIPGNIGYYGVEVQKLLKLSPLNNELYNGFYRSAVQVAVPAGPIFDGASNVNGTDGPTPLLMGGPVNLGRFAPKTTETNALYYESPTITNVSITSTTGGMGISGNDTNNTMTIQGNTGGASFVYTVGAAGSAVTSIGFVQDPNNNSQAGDNVGYSMSNISQDMNTVPDTTTTGPQGLPKQYFGTYDYEVSIEHPGTLLADLSGGATFDGIAFVNSTNADSAITLLDSYENTEQGFTPQ